MTSTDTPAEPTCMVRGTPVLHCLKEDVAYGDFRDDLVRDGYAVVKGVISKEKCDAYIDDIQDWLESFGLGYNRNDPATVKEECLPVIHQKGLIQAYGAPHEVGFFPLLLKVMRLICRTRLVILKSFTWGCRSEPAVIDTFAKLFGTEDLLVSFDAVNVSLANRKDQKPVPAWAHQDQGGSDAPANGMWSVNLTAIVSRVDPERPGFRCVQGFVNLAPSGDEDGGLVVLKEGHKISNEYHDTFREEDRGFRWTNEVRVSLTTMHLTFV